MVEPGAQGLGQPRSRGGRLIGQRRQAIDGELGEDAFVAVGDQRAQVMIGDREPGGRDHARLDQPQGRACALRAVRGRGQLRRRPEHHGRAGAGALEPGGEAGSVGVGDQRDPGASVVAGVGDQRARRQPRPQAAAVAGPGQGRDPLRGLPARLRGGAADRGLVGVRPEQQGRDPAAHALALPRGRRLGLGIAVGRERGEAVDVGEHGLGEQRQRAPVGSGLDRDRRYPPPGDASTEPVGGEQGVERAPLAVLATPEGAIDGVAAGPVELGIGHQVDELPQRLGHPAADPGPEPPSQRPAIGGHALADRLDHLVAERRHVRPDQLSDAGRDRPPGLIDGHFLCADDKYLVSSSDELLRNCARRRVAWLA